MSATLLPRAEGITRFDFDRCDEIQGQTVRSVKAKIAPQDYCPIWYEMVFLGDTLGLHITVNHDTDELIVALVDTADISGADWIDVEALTDCIGCKISWWWSSINSHGYWDMFALSFHGPAPNVAFCSMSSSIHVMRLNYIGPTKP